MLYEIDADVHAAHETCTFLYYACATDLVLYEIDDDIHAAHEAGHVERGQLINGSCYCYHACATDLMLNEIDDNIHAAHEAGHVERGQPALCCCFNGCACLQQQLNHLENEKSVKNYVKIV
jgi:hypothetical protein